MRSHGLLKRKRSDSSTDQGWVSIDPKTETNLSQGFWQLPASQTSERTHRSLASVNFRRAVNYGKIYLSIGVVLSLLFIFGLLPTIHSKSMSATAASIPSSEITTLLLPMFPVMGSVGGLMIFVSDKDKGVSEYLMAMASIHRKSSGRSW